LSNLARTKALSGFTLIEMLIALTLLGIMMSLLMVTFRAGAKSWDAGEKIAAVTEDQFAVRHFLRSYLENARPVIDDFTDELEPKFSFEGDEHSLTFVAGLPANQDRGGLWRFTLEIERGSEKKLVAIVEPFFPGLDDDADLLENLTLLSNVEKFDISYFGKDQITDQDPDWNDRWEDKNELPLLVKIEMQIEGQIEWPATVIAPQIESAGIIGGAKSNKRRSRSPERTRTQAAQ
jgi:general secretion pathway protein J